MQAAFFCCFRQGVAGMSRDLGRDVPESEKLYARKLWADFSYPIISCNLSAPHRCVCVCDGHPALPVATSLRCDSWCISCCLVQ